MYHIAGTPFDKPYRTSKTSGGQRSKNPFGKGNTVIGLWGSDLSKIITEKDEKILKAAAAKNKKKSRPSNTQKPKTAGTIGTILMDPNEFGLPQQQVACPHITNLAFNQNPASSRMQTMGSSQISKKKAF